MRSRIAFAACSLMCLVVAVHAHPPAWGSQEKPDGGSLSGIVVDMASKPVPDARVQVKQIDSPVDVPTAVTTDSGTFSFLHLPPGTYIVSASRAGAITTEYGATRPRGAGTPLVVTAGTVLDHVELSLHTGGVITGLVRHLEGGSAHAGSVTLYEERIGSSGSRVWAIAAQGPADDRGIYRLFGIAPGTYAIRAIPREAASTITGRASEPTFYPSATTLVGAGRVTVVASEEQSHVDIDMMEAQTVRVEGRAVVSGPSRPLQRGDVELDALDSVGTPSRSVTAQFVGEHFAFGAVFPGEYRLQARFGASRPADSASGSRMVSVSSSDMLDADLVLQTPGVLSGRVVVAPESAPVDLSAIRVRLRSLDSTIPPLAEPADGVVSADGTFAVAVDAGGDYRLDAQVVGPPSKPRVWFKSAVLDGRDVSDAIVHVGDGQSMTGCLITVADHLGTVRGTLTDANGHPATGYTVVVFPRNRDLWASVGRRIKVGRPANTGEFVIGGLPAGDYSVAAAIDPEPNAWLTPSFLAALAERSIAAAVQSGSTTVTNLRIPK